MKDHNQQKRSTALHVLLACAVATLCCLPLEVLAQGQWTTNGNNINNTNSGNVGIGTASPSAKLTVSANTGTPPTPSVGTVAYFVNADGGNTFVTADAYGTFHSDFLFRQARGTMASPTASQADDIIGQIQARGYGATGFAATARAGVRLLAAENWTDSAQGSYLSFVTTPKTTVAVAEAMRITDAGNLGIGTTSPTSRLHVTDSTNNTYAARFIHSNSSASNGVYIETQTAGAGDAALHVTSNGGSNQLLMVRNSGNVGIGTASPTSKLHIVGDLTVTGNIAAKYQDVAEWVPSSYALSAGTVVIIDPTKSNQVMASSQAYDTRVAGVISARPGLVLGEDGVGKVLVATTGRLRIKVDATSAPVQVGDLLVTSGKEGIAMKSQPVNIGGVQIHRPGTLIGKALEPLEKGTGEILVLLSLQ